MSEQKYRVRPIGVEYVCDLCNDLDEAKVPMTYTGRDWLTNPIQYEHICSKCKNTKNLDKVYPTIVWEKEIVQHISI